MKTRAQTWALTYMNKSGRWPLSSGVHAEAWRSGWRTLRFTTGSRRPTPTVALLKNLRWNLGLNKIQMYNICGMAILFFYPLVFFFILQRTWSLLVQISQKPLPWSWRTSPRTATTTCCPVSWGSFLQLLSSSPPPSSLSMLYLIVFITSAFFVTSDDSSRVKLSIIHGSPYDDYINANYMPVRTDAPQSCCLAWSFLHHQ